MVSRGHGRIFLLTCLDSNIAMPENEHLPVTATPLPETKPPAGAAGKPTNYDWGMSRFWWLVMLLWLVVSLASVLEIILLRTVSPGMALTEGMGRLIPWLVMSALIIGVSSKFPLDQANWKSSIWIYFAAFILSLAVVAAFAYFGPPPPLFSGQISTGILPWSQHSRSMLFLVLSRCTLQVPTFWGLVAVAQAIHLYERGNLRELREAELQSRLAEARLHALQLQLNPHFLFNTLNSVASLVHDEPATAEKMIEALSELLRLALGATGRQRVTLREELHFLDHYLLIEHIRFGNRLRVEIAINEAVLDDLVPALILQPLVENAVKHGVETQLAPGVVRIAAQAAGAGNFLRLEVSNNGPAFPSAAGRIEERVGLGNTRARLREMFGAEASLELHTVPAGGFIARILVPRRNDGLRPGARPEFSAAL